MKTIGNIGALAAAVTETQVWKRQGQAAQPVHWLETFNRKTS